MYRRAPILNSDSENKREIKYKGVRRRRWGKWVSEIRVPGTSTRLWLGSYSAPEAAAVAHDTAVFFLRGPGPLPASSMNFPRKICDVYKWAPLSPGSVQRVASDAGMTADAQLIEELWRIEKRKSDRACEKELEVNHRLSEYVILEGERERERERSTESSSGDQGFSLYEELSVDDMEIYM